MDDADADAAPRDPDDTQQLNQEQALADLDQSIADREQALADHDQAGVDQDEIQLDLDRASGDAGNGGGQTIAGYDFSGQRTCDTLPQGHACTLQANPVTDACLAAGGQDAFCSDCSVLCNVPVH